MQLTISQNHERRAADYREKGDDNEDHCHDSLVDDVSLIRQMVSIVKSFDQADHHTRGCPNREQGCEDRQRRGPSATLSHLEPDQVFDAWRSDTKEDGGDSSGDGFCIHLDKDGGGGGQNRKECQEARVGCAFGVAEGSVAVHPYQCAAESPPENDHWDLL